MTTVEDHPAQAPHGESDCPSWCAAEGPHADHRSRTVLMPHGPYGDSVTRIHVSQPAERFFPGGAVHIEMWPGGFYPLPDPDKDEPDCHLMFSVAEAASLSDLLTDVVGDTVERTMSAREALARLNDAQELIAKFVAAKRIWPDAARKYSEDEQWHAVVPMALVSQLCAILAPGVHPFSDPYESEEAPGGPAADGTQ